MTIFRRPALKLVKPAVEPRRIHDLRIAHDERGNAIWIGGHVSLEDTGTLALVRDPAPLGFEGDPYNRTTPALAYGR